VQPPLDSAAATAENAAKHAGNTGPNDVSENCSCNKWSRGDLLLLLPFRTNASELPSIGNASPAKTKRLRDTALANIGRGAAWPERIAAYPVACYVDTEKTVADRFSKTPSHCRLLWF
jgi:hypothetical protein